MGRRRTSALKAQNPAPQPTGRQPGPLSPMLTGDPSSMPARMTTATKLLTGCEVRRPGTPAKGQATGSPSADHWLAPPTAQRDVPVCCDARRRYSATPLTTLPACELLGLHGGRTSPDVAVRASAWHALNDAVHASTRYTTALPHEDRLRRGEHRSNTITTSTPSSFRT